MKIKTLSYINIFIFLSLMTGCAQQKMYYWGNYSKTLYDFRKKPGEETLLNHKQELKKIVKVSTEKSLKIPPGVYAELGYLYFRENNGQEAIKFFQLEKQVYPESHFFMDRMVNAVEVREKKDSSN